MILLSTFVIKYDFLLLTNNIEKMLVEITHFSQCLLHKCHSFLCVWKIREIMSIPKLIAIVIKIFRGMWFWQSFSPLWLTSCCIKTHGGKKKQCGKMQTNKAAHLDLSVFFYTLFFSAVRFNTAGSKQLLVINGLKFALIKHTAGKKSV